MREYSTPTVVLTVSDFDFDDIATAYVTFSGANNTKVTKDSSTNYVVLEPTQNTISVWLSQEETALLGSKNRIIEVQINILSTGHERIPSEIKRYKMKKNVLKAVI